jgi:hypothetical protein
VDCWEYQVIHINVEPPKPAAAADDPEAGGVKPVFSETFLKKEFPQFYEKPSEANGGKPQHPAQQLQAFLNGHGSKGWELVGVFPVGSLTMMFFRRPKPNGPAPDPLQEVRRQLDQIEARLGTRTVDRDRPKAATRKAGSGRDGESGRSSSESAAVVSEAQMANLAHESRLPSSQAALAIGLRSATSLANHGTRYGYAQGLSKRGPNGLVAIYSGPGSPQRGGRERRLWIVVPLDRLGACRTLSVTKE